MGDHGDEPVSPEVEEARGDRRQEVHVVELEQHGVPARIRQALALQEAFEHEFVEVVLTGERDRRDIREVRARQVVLEAGKRLL